MPSWRKILVSGSDALLNSIYSKTFVSASSADITTSFTASGLNYPTQDNGEFSFIQTDGNGNLSLQYVNTMYETVYNAELTTISKGTPLYVSGSQGAESKVYRADASNPLKMPVTYVAADNIDPATSGRGIVLGLITGVNTTGYPAGTEIYVGVGGGWTSTRPTGSNIAQLLGIVTKEGVGGQGLVLNPGPYNVPNLLSGQIFWGDTTGTPIKKSLAHILSGSNYIYSGSFSGSFQGDGSQLTGIQQIIPPTTRSVTGSFTSVTSSIITHNLDTENVLVSVYDSTKTYILPNSIQILNEDNVRITFTSPTTGYAVITNGGHVISGSVDWSNLYNVPSGLVSSSAQISFTGIINKPTLVSGSSQINYSGISGKPGGIVSSSAQISALGYTTCTGTVTSVTAGTYLTGGTITTTGTIAVDATNVNTASKIVARDASGNFCAGTITATSFVGDGSGLTGISGVTINNNTDNYLLTATGTTGTVNGEANLTFNGSTLSLTGNLVSTGTGTSFRNRIGIGDGNGTPFTNAGSPGIWLSYNGASDQFIGACSSTIFGVYIGAWRMCVSNTGTVTATCFVETSAQKFKTDIETFSCTDYFNCLRPVSFKWKETGNEDIGFIAEEVNEYYPTLVAKNLEDEPTGVKYTKIVPLLVKKIQEQSEQINQLSIELKDIYNKINKDI